jgi:hypothetical protein
MCKPASFVLTKDRVFWSMHTDSHTEIIDEFGLHEDGARGPNVVKVEISPDNERLDSDPGTWVYKLDQDRTPEWYDAEECERRARAALAEWVSARMITEGNRELSRGNVFVYGNAWAALHDTSAATLFGNARATLSLATPRRGCTATPWQRSTVTPGRRSMTTPRRRSSRRQGEALRQRLGDAVEQRICDALRQRHGDALRQLYRDAPGRLHCDALRKVIGDALRQRHGNSHEPPCRRD